MDFICTLHSVCIVFTNKSDKNKLVKKNVLQVSICSTRNHLEQSEAIAKWSTSLQLPTSPDTHRTWS